MTRYVFSSVTRISDLPQGDFAVEPLPREAWEMGDYVVGHVVGVPARTLPSSCPMGG